MFLRIKKPSPNRRTVQIVESVRDGNRVYQRTVKYLGSARSDQEIDELRRLGEAIIKELRQNKGINQNTIEKRPISPPDPVKLRLQGTSIDGEQDVWGNLFRHMGFHPHLAQSAHHFFQAILSVLADHKPAPKHLPANSIDFSALKMASTEGRVRRAIRSSPLIPVEGNWSAILVIPIAFEEPPERKAHSKMGAHAGALLFLGLTENGLLRDYELHLLREGPFGALAQWCGEGRVYHGIKIPHYTFKRLARKLAPRNPIFVFDSKTLGNEPGLGFTYIRRTRIQPSEVTQKKILNESGFIPLFTDETQDNELKAKLLPSGGKRGFKRTLVVCSSKSKANRDREAREALVAAAEALRRDKGYKISLEGKKKRAFLETRIDTNVSGDLRRYYLDSAAMSSDKKWDGISWAETNLTNVLLPPPDGSSVASGAISAAQIHSLLRCLERTEELLDLRRWPPELRPSSWDYSQLRAHVAVCCAALSMELRLEYQLRIQKGVHMLPERIRSALQETVSVILREEDSGRLFRYPAKLAPDAQIIYDALEIKRSIEPKEINP